MTVMSTHLLAQALDFLHSSLRTYVTSNTIQDKLFAVRLVVAACAMAIDYFHANLQVTISTKTKVPNIENDENISLYRDRISDLESIREVLPKRSGDIQGLMKTYEEAVTTLASLHERNPFPVLLGLNFKEFQNEAMFFIYDIRRLVRGVQGA